MHDPLAPDLQPEVLDRRRWLRWAAGGGASALAGCATFGPKPAARGRSQPVAFSTAELVDGLPQGWLPHVMRRDRRTTEYRCVQKDGRQVLEAVARKATSGLRCAVDVDPHRTPWLQWSWRVDRFPEDAALDDDERDDSPARVIVAFDGDSRRLGLRDLMFAELVELLTGQPLPFAMLMYSWDGRAPVEQVIAYPRSGRIQYLVVESGSARTGQWLSYRRNVLDDYRQVFGAEPGRIHHVGVLNDSDDLQLELQSWFGDIAFEAS